MKRVFPVVVFLFSFLFFTAIPYVTHAKKGGIGHGGGNPDQGPIFHSHSDRSYSGKDVYKGKGNPPGLKGKKKMKPGKSKGPMSPAGPATAKGRGPTGAPGAVKGPGLGAGPGVGKGQLPTSPMGSGPPR